MVIDRTDIMYRHSSWPQRRPEQIKGIVLHRNTVADTADDVAAWYEKHGIKWGIGKRFPYAMLFYQDGTVEQCVEFDHICMGAAGRNTTHLHFACMVDLRVREPTQELLHSLETVCQAVSDWIGAARIERHSDSPRKHCPGDMLDVEAINDHCRLNLKPQGAKSERKLIELGITI